MASRDYWSGSIKISLVTVGVRLYRAWLNHDDDEDEYSNIEQDESVISINEFIPQDKIRVREALPDRRFEVVPDGPVAQQPYLVLRAAMMNEGVVGFGRVTIAGRARSCVLRPEAGSRVNAGFVLTTLHLDLETGPEAEYVRLATGLIRSKMGQPHDESTDGPAKPQSYTVVSVRPRLSPAAEQALRVYRAAQSLLSLVHVSMGDSEDAHRLLDGLSGVLAAQVPDLQVGVRHVRSAARLTYFPNGEPIRSGDAACASAIEAVELLGVRLMTTFIGIHEPPLQDSEIREGLRRRCPPRAELADLKVRLARESEAVVAALNQPSGPAVPSTAAPAGASGTEAPAAPVAATIAANIALQRLGQQATASNVVLLGGDGTGRSVPFAAVPGRAAEQLDGAAPARANRTEPHLLDEHFAVLRRLADLNRARTRAELSDDLSTYGRDAIHNAVNDLHRWGMVHCPPKSPKGASILEKGRAALAEFERRSAGDGGERRS